jgi:radical SAM-linked protein
MVSDLRRTSLTFAVESASEELRRIAHKRLPNADLLAIMEHVFRRGWRVFKLYFMIGLPGCGEHDEAGAILDLLEKIKRLPGGKREINVTVSPFVPKPHTPFQYEPQRDGAYLEETLQRIRKGAPRSVTVKNHNLRASLLEGVLSRGDERLGAVIHRSYLDGCRLDSWGECLRFDLWEKNLNALLPGWRGFLAGRAGDAVLPWSIIETGFEKLVSHKKERETQRMMPRRGGPGIKALAPDGGALGAFERKYGVKARLRVRFAKKGTAKFIPHIDFMEIIKKALRMARVPVSFTQGFNKRERISLGYPLPLGVESLAELCDIDLYEEFLPDESFLPLLGGLLPEGIEAVRARPVEGKESLMGATVAAEYRVTADGPGLLEAMERNLGSWKEFSKETKGGEKKLESERVIREHSLEGGALRLVLPVGCEEAMRIDQVVLQLAGAPHGEWYRFRAVKVRQFRREGDSLAEIE